MDGLVHVRFADIQHGGKPDDVAVQAALADQQAVLAGAFEQLIGGLGSGLLGHAVLHQFEASIKPLPRTSPITGYFC
jgi:hypothetical protein